MKKMQGSAPASLRAKPNAEAPERSLTGAKVGAKPTDRTPPSSLAGAKRRAKPMVIPLQPQSVVGQDSFDAQRPPADDTPIGGGHAHSGTHARSAAPDLLNLRIFAEVFEDVQKQRIATTNRAERGGVDPIFFVGVLQLTHDAEKEAKRIMLACYRATVPPGIQQWQKDTPGIGDHLLARLLGVIGHPVHTTVYEWEGAGHDRVLVEVGPMDRTVSQLWSYCGHGDAMRKRRAGMTAEDAAAMGNPRAKMLVRLLAEACLKQNGVSDKNGKARASSPYREVYDEARMDYESRDWTDLHRHNAALRKVGKAILKDLWIEAGGGQSKRDAHEPAALSRPEDTGSPAIRRAKPKPEPQATP